MSERPKGCIVLLTAMFLLLLLPFLWRQVVVRRYSPHIHDASNAPSRPTAIVFGAAVLNGGRLSTVLRDRMDVAIQLYRQGSVEKLMVSGDGLSANSDEPAAMMSYAVRHGVAEADILVDRAGRRTYDTCHRAQNLFGLHEAILVTQEFHLSRALFVCERLGIEAEGVAADRRAYRAARWYELRETAATIVALSDIIRHREPANTTLVPVSQGIE